MATVDSSPAEHLKRIVLLCPGLEEGRNGVGDYCRRMARELARRQILCHILSLNDRDVPEVTQEASSGNNQTGSLVRIPAQLAPAERAHLAAHYLKQWQPDWVSLQFVSYGFQPRGIALRESSWLPRLLAPFRLELMMHELWIGIDPAASIKNRVIGRIQRSAITRLIRRARPDVIHTTNEVFRRLLRQVGVEANPLPLFGNIPVENEPAPWLSEILRNEGGIEIDRDRQRSWLFGFFGGIPRAWRCDSLIEHIDKITARTGRTTIVVSVGQVGVDAAERFSYWRERYPAIRFIMLGPRPAVEISQFLNTIDFGLTSYPFYMLGKSGSAAAMLEHGVPVIAAWGMVRSELDPVYPPYHDLVWPNDESLADRLLLHKRRARKKLSMVERVAEMFLTDLSKAATLRKPHGHDV
jgi:hypothetical protein